MAELPGGVRIKDVAAAAGVSVGTVSNVLNRPHLVAVPTRRRVSAVISRLGFVRSESARQLRSGSSRTVAMLVLDVANPYLTDVVRGVEDEVGAAGLVVMLAGSGGLFGREQRYLEMFQQQRVRGLLWNPTNLTPPGTDGFDRLGIPLVFLDRHLARTHSNVAVDDVAGGRIAAEHLLSRGHRRIAVVGGPATLAQIEDRRDGAYEAIRRVSDAATTFLTVPTPDLTLRSGRGAADQLLAMHPASRPTGVFAANDLVAIGLLQGLLAHGIRVPDEVAIVGFDDMEFAAAAAVPLTSVRAPRAELGRHAARLLLEEIEARENGAPVTPRHLRFEPDLVPRASTAHQRPLAGGSAEN